MPIILASWTVRNSHTNSHAESPILPIFDRLRCLDKDGNEYWLARQLAGVLEYSQYRHFLPVIERAKEACANSGQSVANHFEEILAMVEIGSGAKRELPDVRLSRYACYLIGQAESRGQVDYVCPRSGSTASPGS